MKYDILAQITVVMDRKYKELLNALSDDKNEMIVKLNAGTLCGSLKYLGNLESKGPSHRVTGIQLNATDSYKCSLLHIAIFNNEVGREIFDLWRDGGGQFVPTLTSDRTKVLTWDFLDMKNTEAIRWVRVPFRIAMKCDGLLRCNHERLNFTHVDKPVHFKSILEFMVNSNFSEFTTRSIFEQAEWWVIDDGCQPKIFLDDDRESCNENIKCLTFDSEEGRDVAIGHIKDLNSKFSRCPHCGTDGDSYIKLPPLKGYFRGFEDERTFTDVEALKYRFQCQACNIPIEDFDYIYKISEVEDK